MWMKKPHLSHTTDSSAGSIPVQNSVMRRQGNALVVPSSPLVCMAEHPCEAPEACCSEAPSPGSPGRLAGGRAHGCRGAADGGGPAARHPVVATIVAQYFQNHLIRGWGLHSKFPHPSPEKYAADDPIPYFQYADSLWSGEAGRGPEVGVAGRLWEAASVSACNYQD